MKEKKTSKRRLTSIFALTFAVILTAGTIVLTGCGDKGGSDTSSEPEPVINPITGIEVEGELPARPVQVSIPIDNYGALPQSNISYADIVYEMPAEGQMTRAQAIFYSEFPDFVGPVRSVRPYFVDVATEYKACHVGYGWGKNARSNMESNNVPYINGYDDKDNDLFYRDPDRSNPDDACIEWSNIEQRAEEEGWFEETKTIKPFKFRDDEWKAEQKEAKADAEAVIEEKGSSDDPEDVKAVEKAKALLADPEKATSINVSSNGTKSAFEYDSESKNYAHTQYGEAYIDKETGEQIKVDNVIVQKVHSNIMTDDATGASDSKGRLEIDMYAGGDALLFTNGEVVTGTWSREDVNSRTIFKDEDGNQFRLTPGKTWVYVLDQNYTLEYN